MCQVRHEPQEVWTFDTFVEYLVADTAFVRYAGYESGVLDLDGHFSCWLLTSLTSSIVSTLLVEVEACFINEDDLAFTKGLCFVERQEPLEELHPLYLVLSGVRLHLHPLDPLVRVVRVPPECFITAVHADLNTPFLY